MASNYTTNYQLNQWEPTDQVQRTDFNADNAKIDAALKTNADAIAAETAARTAAVALCGNCQIYVSSYTGSGQTTYQHPNNLTFPGDPRVVFVNGSADHLLAFRPNNSAIIYTDALKGLYVTWGSKSLSWYSTTARDQLNRENVSYTVIALLDAAE